MQRLIFYAALNDELDHYEECIDAELLLEEEVIFLVFQLIMIF